VADNDAETNDDARKYSAIYGKVSNSSTTSRESTEDLLQKDGQSAGSLIVRMIDIAEQYSHVQAELMASTKCNS